MSNMTQYSKVHLVDSLGQIVSAATGSLEFIRANNRSNLAIVEQGNPYPAAYWDFVELKWQEIPTKPFNEAIFNYTTKQWEDPRTLDEGKTMHWAKIKAERDAAEYAGFEFEGRRYDSDMKSQGRISAAASLGAPVEWTLQDNSTIWLSPADLQGLVQALAQHVTSVHERGRVARQLIYDAETIEQVEAVTL